MAVTTAYVKHPQSRRRAALSRVTRLFVRLTRIAALCSCCASQVCIATSQPDLKVFQINPRLYEEYAGNYQLAPDRVISLGPFSEAGGRLVFFDSQTRRFGVLYPLSETQFVTGTLQENGMVTPADLYVTFTRTPTGKVSGLVWQEGSAGSLKGIKVNPHRNEEIVFNNGDVELHGTLTVPATAGPHPAVVLLQEAGPRSRPFGIWPYLFARHGIAMLTFDKRGVGVSTGDWQTASFSDLAGDALAAVRLLRSRSDIDAKHIGLWGNSNSGWLVPLAAVRSKDVAFLITRVGSSLPPTENILFEIENQMREQGFSEEEISKAVALRRQLQSAILTNKGWAEFIAAAKSARNERWFPSSRVARYAAAQLPPDELRLQAWRGPLAFDPIPYWEKVSCPVLAIYGELDKNTPTARNVPPLVAALKRGGNRDYTIIILPKTDHHFYENATESLGYFAEIAAMQRFVPGYVDRMMNWIAQRASD